jgi:hypothetical protein
MTNTDPPANPMIHIKLPSPVPKPPSITVSVVEVISVVFRSTEKLVDEMIIMLVVVPEAKLEDVEIVDVLVLVVLSAMILVVAMANLKISQDFETTN